MKTKNILKFVIFQLCLVVLLSFIGTAGAVMLGKDGTVAKRASNSVSQNNQTTAKTQNFAANEIIVKLKHKEPSKTLYTMTYAARSSGDTSLLSGLKAKYNLKEERPVFQSLHNQLKPRNLSQAKLAEKAAAITASGKAALSTASAASSEAAGDLFSVYVLKTTADVLTTCNSLKEDPNVEYAEPNYIRRAQMVPNDLYYLSRGSWGQSYDDLWGLKKMQCEAAWDISQGEGAVAAVIDTGVDYNHPDLAANIWINKAELNGAAGVDDDGNGYVDDIRGWDFAYNDNDPLDNYGHGTHCAGTIAAVGNNNVGIIGVAPKAKVMALKGLDDNGDGYDTSLADCIYYAANNGAGIISASWGGPDPSQILTDAFHYADSKGCVCVVAAGNDNADASTFIPAGIDTVMAVAATDVNDKKASFSNWGSKIDVSAPGIDILSLRAAGTDMYGGGIYFVPRGDSNAGYFRCKGTSMACPHVAGLAALILSKHPEFTNNVIRRTIQVSADDLGIPELGYGRINAHAAMNIVTPPAAATADITFPASGASYLTDNVTIEGTATAESFGYYELEYRQKKILISGQTTYGSWIPISEGFSAVEQGTLGTWDAEGLWGDYILRLGVHSSNYTAYDSVYAHWGWPFRSGDSIAMSPVIADLNVDGALEVLFGTFYEGKLYCLDKAGKKIWEYQTEGPSVSIGSNPNCFLMGSSPVVTDLNGRGATPPARDVLVVAGSAGRIYCITANGEKRWEYSTGQTDCASPVMADLDGNGSKEIILCAGSDIHCLNKDGQLVWKHTVGLDGSLFLLPTVADVNDDGKLEIIVSVSTVNGNGIYCINKDGGLVWQQQTIAPCSPSVAADLDGDGKIEIIVGSMSRKLYCLANDGSVRWVYDPYPDQKLTHIEESVSDCPAVADLDGDGSLEIITSVQGSLYCLNKDGSKKWEYKIGYIDLSSAVIADMDGDGSSEILFTGLSNDNVYLCCIDKNGQGKWMRAIDTALLQPYYPPMPTPAVADLDGDGNLEVLIGTRYGTDGELYCIDKNGEIFIPGTAQSGITFNPMPWPSFHHDPQLTGWYGYKGLPPFLAPIGNKSIDEGKSLTFRIAATDPEGTALQFSVDNMPAGARLLGIRQSIFGGSSAAVFGWTPSYTQAGIYNVTFKASDGTFTDSEKVILTVNNVNGSPAITPIGDKNVNRGETLKFTVKATDPDGDAVSYQMYNAPSNANMNSQTGAFSWCPTKYQVGNFKVLFVAKDSKNNQSSETITIKVPNSPPVLNPIGPKAVLIGEKLSIRLSATDPDPIDLNNLKFNVINAPFGAPRMSLSGVFSWKPNKNQVGTYNVKFRVSDIMDATDEEVVTITVTR
ncbi:MAG: S8 family serine peptidase [Candidatus Omnitrophota bacterium]